MPKAGQSRIEPFYLCSFVANRFRLDRDPNPQHLRGRSPLSPSFLLLKKKLYKNFYIFF
jgi:hypothetical protein